MKEKGVKKLQFDYMWVTVGLCFIMVAVSLGLCSSGRNLYLTAITDALNIPRGAFSLNTSIRYIVTTVANLYFGTLVYKFGTKKLICAGFICLMAFALINSYASSLYLFYIGSVFLGLGLAWTTTTMTSAIVNRWCPSNKGTITGAILAANGIGGAVAVQIISPIIFEEGNPFGYRNSYHLVFWVLVIVFLLMLVLFRENPKGSYGKMIVERKKHQARGEGWSGMEFSYALKKPYFYICVACVFLTGMGLQGIGGIAFPHYYDMGLDVAFVAAISSMSSLLLTVSKFSVGFLYDRLGIRLSMNICFVSALLSLVGLILVTNTPLGRVFAVLRAIFAAIALPLETVMLPLFASEFFGNKDFSKFVGVFASATTAGFALGAPLGNICFDFFNSYNPAFILFGIMMVFVTLGMQYVYSSAQKDKKRILDAENSEIPA